MTESDNLDAAYSATDKDELRALYASWADDYEAEVLNAGYVSPRRCAEALAAAAAELDAPVLDLGCGTGLSGEALRRAGFERIDGTDFSPEMLTKAEERGIYRQLILADFDDPLPFARGDYAAIAAVGVFSPGHGAPALIDATLQALARGGLFVFTLNDHALRDPGYEGRLRDWIDGGAARLLFKERGPHLPAAKLEAEVWVVERA